MSTQVLDMHCKVEEIREFIQEKARENYSLESQKRQIQKFMEKTEKDIDKIKALCRNPVNRVQSIDRMSDLERQKKVLKREMPALDLSLIAKREISFVERDYDNKEIQEELEGMEKGLY